VLKGKEKSFGSTTRFKKKANNGKLADYNPHSHIVAYTSTLTRTNFKTDLKNK